ncbi:MAG: energy transducer TonB [Gemmatimonadetes bacterium]|nr:energy transducer TonB [Gemmatimonadota bacterium]MCC6769864.1 energy transducer TonB [Gemmatimonadaceae bacterium]
MLFRRLVEKNARGTLLITIEGYAVSILAHAVIIVPVVIVSQQAGTSRLAESFTPVEYFMPRDRILGSKPKQERITFVSTESQGGGGEPAPDPASLRPAEPPADPGPGLTEMSSELSEEEAPSADATGDTVMTVLEVDSAAARYDDSAAPPYPPTMLEKKIEGSVGIQYVVDTTGHADTTSIIVLTTTHEAFATSVKNTLPLMQFRPAIMNGRKVRQLVQQMFAFRIDTTQYAQQQKKREKP